MGFLFSKLWSRLFAYDEFKICIIGLSNAGKTTTLYKLHLGDVISTQPTIGSNVEEVVHNNIRLQVWDLGGQAQLRSTWANYFINTHAIIMVVDSSDRKNISIVKEELHRVLKLDSLKKAVVLVFANKQDVPDGMKPAEIATALDLTTIRGHTWHIQGCCALTGEGLYEGLDWITTQVTSS